MLNNQVKKMLPTAFAMKIKSNMFCEGTADGVACVLLVYEYV